MINVLTVAKVPTPGRVKTRLMPDLSAHQAAALAAASLLDTLDAVLATPASRPVVALHGDLSRAMASETLTQTLRRCDVLDQRGTGLPARLANAHADAGPTRPVLQIGMDTPQVSAELLADGAALLTAPDGPDAVLGLAEDGGWWSLGVRRGAMAHILAGVPMSRPDTGELTLCALINSGLSVAMLPMLRDVDTVADVVEVARLVPDGRFGRLAGVLLPDEAGVRMDGVPR